MLDHSVPDEVAPAAPQEATAAVLGHVIPDAVAAVASEASAPVLDQSDPDEVAPATEVSDAVLVRAIPDEAEASAAVLDQSVPDEVAPALSQELDSCLTTYSV